MFDPAGHELARHFLGSLIEEKIIDELAQHIQDEIEIWIEVARDEHKLVEAP